MSVRALSWVFDHSDVTHRGDLLVLLVLADHAHDDGTSAYPSVDRIARKARLTRRGAQLALRRLTAAGAIEDTGERGPRGTVVYRLVMGEATSQRSEYAGEVSAAGGEPSDTEGANCPSPEPSLEPSEEPSSYPQPHASRGEQDVFDVTTVKLPRGRTASFDSNRKSDVGLVDKAIAGWATTQGLQLSPADAAKTVRRLAAGAVALTAEHVQEAHAYYCSTDRLAAHHNVQRVTDDAVYSVDDELATLGIRASALARRLLSAHPWRPVTADELRRAAHQHASQYQPA